MSWTIGVDVGGTFTDFYAVDATNGASHVGKVPSTPANPADAVLKGLLALCQRYSIPLAAIRRLSHGTTVGTNALIQRQGGRVALINHPRISRPTGDRPPNPPAYVRSLYGSSPAADRTRVPL